MKHNYEYMKDSSFLKELDLCLIKEQYVKITTLNFRTEAPLFDVTGMVTGGSINVDGSSSMRRTGSMSVTIPKEEYVDIMNPDSIFSMNKKVDIQIGYKNILNKYTEYDIIWIPMGLFIITGASVNHTENGIDVGLQLKDKMCLLSGEVSGTFPAAIILNEVEDVIEYATETENSSTLEGTYSAEAKTITTKATADLALMTEDENNKSLVVNSSYILEYDYEISNPSIYQIIQELVNHYGGEQLGNILIENIPDRIKSVIQYNGKKALYGYYSSESQGGVVFSYSNPWNESGGGPVALPNRTTSNSNGKFNSKDVIGYRYTDFTYPGELSGAAGESVTSVLDKIVNTLGNFEYFYDTDGIFHFREKRNFLNTTQATMLDNLIKSDKNADYDLITYSDKAIYNFDDNKLISTISVSPQYDKIKNDLIIWGKRTSSSGAALPIRYHLAIDKKPELTNKDIYTVVEYIDSEMNLKKYRYVKIITESQESLNDFMAYIKENELPGFFYAAQGHYNTESENWGVLYYDRKIDTVVQMLDLTVIRVKATEYRTKLYMQGIEAAPLAIDSNDYYAELSNEWPKIYDMSANYDEENDYYTGEFRELGGNDYDYFLDFLDVDSEVGKYSIDSIGKRTKIVVDDTINCIFEPGVPDVVLISSEKDEAEIEEATNNGIPYTQVSDDVLKNTSYGHNFNSAYLSARNMLYEYTQGNESISITTVPILYLEPNNIISITDRDIKLDGDYILNNYSITLGLNSTMSMSAQKVPQNI